ncbi:transposase [Candidatus Palauibacter sp.]|uniref:transposase n=1 Tax=Candidatus Palauibacter sp. TaxID=3101350 RepID=UPI003B0161CB
MGRRGAGGRRRCSWLRRGSAPGHPFYRALDGMLAEAGFDGLCEETCAAYYAERLGRPSVAPGVYFRMLVVGYLEGIGSERGIAWRCAESLSLREFLGYELDENPPDHSTVSRTRRACRRRPRGSVRPCWSAWRRAGF